MSDPNPFDDLPNGWGPVLDGLSKRKAGARAMGGPDKIARRREAGRLDARARIAALVDDGSFVEIGALVGQRPADALVAGSGLVDGRPVFVGAEDFTVLGGSIGGGASAKRARLADLAVQERTPLVMLLEGAGHRPPSPGEAPHPRGAGDLQLQARLSGLVPLITAVMGPSAGHGALTAPLSDFTVMTADASIFTAGPPVVKASLGEDVTKEDLGGPGVAVASGVIHNVAGDDAAAIDVVRSYLSFMPSSGWAYPPVSTSSTDPGPRSLGDILDIVPFDGATDYDMREVVSLLVDDGAFFQVQPDFGSSLICGLARLGGQAVAIVANQPGVISGSIDCDAAEKGAHFISVADSFHLPLLFLADNPGVLAGTASEQQGILRAGARMFAAQTRAQTIKIHVTLRKAFGFGSSIMAMNGFDGQSISVAFPGATLGAMGSSGAANATGADDEQRAALAEAELASSYRSASGLAYDDLIDPRELRNVVLAGLARALPRRPGRPEPVRRTGTMP
jgi:acetyl-CoA carboxylase carboxyltransferase component